MSRPPRQSARVSSLLPLVALRLAVSSYPRAPTGPAQLATDSPRFTLVRAACADSKACHSFKHHFEECAERINAGNKHIEAENCVEELCKPGRAWRHERNESRQAWRADWLACGLQST